MEKKSEEWNETIKKPTEHKTFCRYARIHNFLFIQKYLLIPSQKTIGRKPELFDFNKCKRLHRKTNVFIGWSRYWKITVLLFSYPNKYYDILVGIQ